MHEPGILSLGAEDIIHIEFDGEHYRLMPGDIRNLLFTGRSAPIIQNSRTEREDLAISIEGHASINRSGKAVIFYTRAGHFIVPLVSFMRVARGEAVSAPLFPLIPDNPGASA